MRFCFWAMVVVATMAMMACGGASGSDPTEAGLRSRAESQGKAVSDEDWAGWYKFFSPGNKSVCSEAEFSAAIEIEMSSFRESRELEESDKLEFRVREVTVQGTQGLVVVDIYLDGELLFDSINDNWVFADGNWWSMNSGGSLCQFSPTPTPPLTTPTPVCVVHTEASLNCYDGRLYITNEQDGRTYVEIFIQTYEPCVKLEDELGKAAYLDKVDKNLAFLSHNRLNFPLDRHLDKRPTHKRYGEAVSMSFIAAAGYREQAQRAGEMLLVEVCH